MRIRFVDRGLEAEAAPGVTLLEVAEAHGVPMEAACGGFAACNTCRVEVVEGQLSPRDDVELPFLDHEGQRLACQARIVADVTVRLAPG